MKAMVFDIQRFSIHDGPGIRTTVFFKGCSLRCLWCSNPESQNQEPELLFTPVHCIHCGICKTVCPVGAVGSDPWIDRSLCTSCGICAKHCPTGALKMKGREYTVEELFAEIERDRRFFQSSGGGVTFSGGEPFLQGEFLSSILEYCRHRGIHTAVETCGQVPFTEIQRCLPDISLVLYDIKAADDQAHRRGTGYGNKIIRENLERLLTANAPMMVRFPAVPGYTAGEHARQTAEYLASAGISCVEVLEYHEFGSMKYSYLGREYQIGEIDDLDAQQCAQETEEIFKQFGIRVIRNTEYGG